MAGVRRCRMICDTNPGTVARLPFAIWPPCAMVAARQEAEVFVCSVHSAVAAAVSRLRRYLPVIFCINIWAAAYPYGAGGIARHLLLRPKVVAAS